MKFRAFLLMMMVFLCPVNAKFLRGYNDDTFQDDGLNFMVKNQSEVYNSSETGDYILTLPRERNDSKEDYPKKVSKTNCLFVFYEIFYESQMQCTCNAKDEEENNTSVFLFDITITNVSNFRI